MYAGQIVEEGPTRQVYDSPAHPYTAALLDSIVDISEPPRRLEAIPGQPPSLGDMLPGCRYAPRCVLAVERCKAPVPLTMLGADRAARCVFAKRIVTTGEYAS
jgi:peptide/nickel transport system ATP-binding protein